MKISLEDAVKQEAVQQVKEGYDWFRWNARKLWLPEPEVTIHAEKEGYAHAFRNFPERQAPTGALCVAPIVNLEENADGVKTITAVSSHVYSEFPNLSAILGDFFHEGAEAAYLVARMKYSLPYSRSAGEFIGNLAEAELTGRIRTYPIKVKFRQDWLSKLLGFAVTVNGLSVPGHMVDAVTQEVSQWPAIDGCKYGLGNSMGVYLDANALILTGKSRNPFFKSDFLNFLAEGSYPADQGIQQLFQGFEAGCNRS